MFLTREHRRHVLQYIMLEKMSNKFHGKRETPGFCGIFVLSPSIAFRMLSCSIRSDPFFSSSLRMAGRCLSIFLYWQDRQIFFFISMNTCSSKKEHMLSKIVKMNYWKFHLRGKKRATSSVVLTSISPLSVIFKAGLTGKVNVLNDIRGFGWRYPSSLMAC